MKVFPTLHIRQGQAIRPAGTATQGQDVPNANPLDLVARLADLGCPRLALVDVDAAKGTGNNRECLAHLMRVFRQRNAHRACIWVGGGVRASDQAQFFLDEGAQCLMVGTLLHKSPMLVDQLLGRFREHLAATIDASQGLVQASGWAERTTLRAEDLATRVRELGFRRILFMDVPSSPVQGEPDFATARRIADHARLPLFMGGSLERCPAAGELEGLAALQGVLLGLTTVFEAPSLLQALSQPCA